MTILERYAGLAAVTVIQAKIVIHPRQTVNTRLEKSIARAPTLKEAPEFRVCRCESRRPSILCSNHRIPMSYEKVHLLHIKIRRVDSHRSHFCERNGYGCGAKTRDNAAIDQGRG